MLEAVLVGAVVVVVAAAEEEVEQVQIQAAAVLWKAHILMTAGPSALLQEHLELVYYTFDKENFPKTRLQFHSSENKQKNTKSTGKSRWNFRGQNFWFQLIQNDIKSLL